jgi:hypothetical protein
MSRMTSDEANQELLQVRTLLETRRRLSEIPQRTLSWLLGDRKSRIELTVQRYEDGMLPTYDAVVLLSALVAEQPASVLEIGTYMGHTTRKMAENLPDAVIHTVDLPEGIRSESELPRLLPLGDDTQLIRRREVGREFRGWDGARRIVQHFGDTAVWDFREAGRPDFFFIDGAHTYEYCLNDSEKCFALCGGAGVFVWHDCDEIHPGVVRFVAHWREMGRDLVRIAGTSLVYWKSVGATSTASHSGG